MPESSILLVDDDEVAVFLMRRVLESVGEISDIRIAGDGLAALDALTAGFRPSVILLDINMPRMNGFEFLDAYAELAPELRESVVVVMLTTSLLDRDRERAAATGLVDRYITKPLTRDHVEELLGRRGG